MNRYAIDGTTGGTPQRGTPSEEFSMQHEDIRTDKTGEDRVTPGVKPSEEFKVHHDEKKALPFTPGEGGEGPSPVPPPVCIPVAVGFLTVDPPDSPLTLGTPYTFSVTASGTEPYTYQWYLNGAATVATATYGYTLDDADIINKDETGLGVIRVHVELTNACGDDSTDPLGSFAAQGNP
jgi:hypothetical protein